MIRTVRSGIEILIDGTKIEIREIDPLGKWVRVEIKSTEHVKIQQAQSEPQAR